MLTFFWVFALSAQPGFSRQASRFHFRSLSIASGQSISVPYWQPVDPHATGLYVGAVSRYGLLSLTECMVGGRFSMGGNSFQWDVVSSGNVNFRTGTSQLGFNRLLSSKTWLGSTLGFSFTGVKGYQTQWSPVAGLTLGGMLGQQTTWGFGWENPQVILSEKFRRHASSMRLRFGLAQSFSSRLSAYGEMEWESVSEAAVMLRIFYRLNDRWKLDLGWGWSPEQLLFGLHRSIRGGWLGMGFSHDPQLGSSFSVFVNRNRLQKK